MSFGFASPSSVIAEILKTRNKTHTRYMPYTVLSDKLSRVVCHVFVQHVTIPGASHQESVPCDILESVLPTCAWIL